MRNFVQPGEKITIAAPAALSSGDGVLVGSLFGVAEGDAASGETVVILIEGIVDLPKAASVTPGVGAKVYWDDTNKVITTTATGNTLVGCAVVAAAASDATVRVRLNGTV